MFAHIVPNRRLPKQFTGFTYEIPEEFHVQIGQFVIAPLRNQKIVGIVTQISSEKPPYAAKKIDRVLESSLPSFSLPLFEWMSKTYDTSLASVLQTCLPEAAWPSIKKVRITKAREKNLPEKIFNQPTIQIAEDHIKQLEELTRHLVSRKTPTLILEKSPISRSDLFINIRHNIPKDSQLLWISPETLYTFMPTEAKSAVFHGDLTARQKKEVCEKVASGEILNICGTRASLFLPFKNLGAIVLDFEHNESYIEKRSPKYHALEVAKKIAQLQKIPMIVLSATPRVETYFAATQGEFELTSWPKDPHQILTAKTSVISMVDERRKGNFGDFSEDAMSKIARTISTGGQVLLFSHRTGQAGALICRDCGNIFRCATCTTPLAVHTGNILKCHSCKTSAKVPYSCPNCGNVKLKSIGFGTQTLEEDMRLTYGRAKIVRLDSETKFDAEKLKDADIIVATSIIEKPIYLPRLTLSIAVMPDSMLQFPHFRAAERVLQLLTHIRNLTNPKGEFLIQTFLPEHPLFQNIEKNSLETFYDSELKTRKSLRLPPFSQ